MAYFKSNVCFVAVYVQIAVTFRCHVPCFWWDAGETQQVSEPSHGKGDILKASISTSYVLDIIQPETPRTHISE